MTLGGKIGLGLGIPFALDALGVGKEEDDNSAYEQYMNRRRQRKLEKEKSLSVEEDLASLKSEMSEIKSLLKELVNGN